MHAVNYKPRMNHSLRSARCIETRTLRKSWFAHFCVGALTLAITSSLMAEDWAQFRGPNCSGISKSEIALPFEFSSQDNVLWSAEIGDGIGSPIVASGRVFNSAMKGKDTVLLFCHEMATGKLLWKRSINTGALLDVHETNSHASTTPAADDKRVYFYFSTVGLMAFDAETGTDAWTLELPVPYFVFKWGPAMSPVLFDNMVIFCQDDDLNPAMYAVDKETGSIIWKDDRNDMAVNYSHPVICETENGPELIVGGTGKLIGYDPYSGKRLWYAKTLLRNIKTTPVSHNGIIYLSLESSGIANQWLATADRSETGNNDGKLSKEEIQAFVGKAIVPDAFFAKFDQGDTNQDGLLEGPELEKAFLHPDNVAGALSSATVQSQRFVQAIKGGGRGDVTSTHVLWNFADRTPDHIVSPLVVDDRMFVMKGGGITSCFSTGDGEPLWHLRRIPNFCEYFASPIYGDGKIYIAGENGFVVVIQSSPDLQILAKNDMGESIVATPAIADGHLLIRTRTKIFCVAQLPN